jgi:hypothetical protein
MDSSKLIKRYNIINFNWEKYITVYNLELEGINTIKEAYKYFINTGFKKGHKWFGVNRNKKRKAIDKINYNEFYKRVKDQINITDYDNNKKEEKINILIRHTYRPIQFKKCIESILKQNYSNYRIILNYDDIKCLEYLKDYNNIEYFYNNIESIFKYKFNLYSNILLNKVNDGWIIFLDDDDMFTDINCLKKINTYLVDDNTILFWKFLRPDKIIYPKKLSKIYCGYVASCGYCFNYKYKNSSEWVPRRSGDFYFLNKLLNQNFKREFIDEIITSTVYSDRTQNFGKKEN